MFDLEKAISDWKSPFRQDSALSEDRVHELETHLRESAEKLATQGLNSEEAFIIATRRLGHATALTKEYAKNGNGGVQNHRIAWMLMGYLAFTLVSFGATTVDSALFVGMALSGINATATGIAATLVQIIFWTAALGLAYRQLYSSFNPSAYAPLWIFFIGITVLFLFTTVLRTAEVSFVGPAWIAEAYFFRACGRVGIQLAIYAFCIFVVYRLRQNNLAME